MSSSELNELSKKSKTDSQELWRWRIRQLDIPTQASTTNSSSSRIFNLAIG